MGFGNENETTHYSYSYVSSFGGFMIATGTVSDGILRNRMVLLKEFWPA